MARYQQIFWLDDTKADENHLLGLIGELKSVRFFSRAIRAGLAIFDGLTRRDVMPIVEFIRDIRALPMRDSDEQQRRDAWLIRLEKLLITFDSGHSPPGSDDIAKRIEELQQLILQNHTPGGMLMSARQQVNTPVMEIKDAKYEGNPNANFVSSLASLPGNI